MSREASGTFSYLRQYYFDDAKLSRLAKLEFVRAVRSGRLVAFTGSMSTAEFGYPGWRALLSQALDIASTKLSGHDPQNLIPTLRETGQRDGRFDSRVAFSAVAQMLDHRDGTGATTAEALDEVAALFRKSRRVPDREKTIVAALLDELHIDRVVTTNYDLELERHTMALRPRYDADDAWDLVQSIEELRKEKWLHKGGAKDEGYSYVLNLANGDRVVSDLMLRDRPDTLIEFAIGCPENDRHIFHLHGRADQPRELILSYRDYDRLYRRRGLAKLPFEHALRILFAGNPVLFVGLGMSEPELNKTLSEFVGDHPYLRKTPAFLIWNTPKRWRANRRRGRSAVSSAQRKAAFRLDMLHRLGILTLFADDLAASAGGIAAMTDPGEMLRQSLLWLSDEAVVAQKRRRDQVPAVRWRHALPRIKRALSDPDGKGRVQLINTWNVEWTDRPGAVADYPGALPVAETFMTVLIRPDGASKTSLAMEQAKRWIGGGDDRVSVILNFNMRIDTDSTLAFIGDLLRYEPGRSDEENLKRQSSRESEFADPTCTGLRAGGDLLLVLKGLERIFDVNGHPLSAEFDQFLRTMAARHEAFGGRLRFVVIATERVETYFSGLGDIASVQICRLAPFEAAAQRSSYLDALHALYPFRPIEEVKLENRELADHSAKRRTLYRTVLTPQALAARGVAEAELALDIITAMSFIGQPIERGALFHAPAIQKRLRGHADTAARRAVFNETFDDLIGKAHLIREINKRPNDRRPEHHRRYSVHLSLQTEIRDRNGIPLSDSILSTAYNMSLFCAQPADTALPEAEVHDELGRLVDWMIGAYKDDPLDPNLRKGRPEAPHVVAALRAAVSLVRGLYSTSALLSVDRGHRLISEEREGLLGEHAQRLERILDAFDAVWRARCTSSAKGAEPLYADELVWLHNERGVVKLAQGDLYEARFSFDEADRVNRLYVEHHHESHNWRRITLNQIVVDIERGRLQSAEDRMNAVERRLGTDKVRRIRARYLDSKSVRRIRFDPHASHEDILAMALITGYRGLTSHLRGELDASRINFDRAICVLQRMDEQRALALFRRHKASVHGDLNEPEALRHEARLAVSGAESVRQLDIVYASRLLEACVLDDKGDAAERKEALRAALEALDYATLADMHRLSIEAQSRLAWAKFHGGDYDAALEHASEAMATATRYGMTLYKISLRTLLGQILIRRGNGDSGRALVQSAINGALRIGYQRAIGAARQVLAAR